MLRLDLERVGVSAGIGCEVGDQAREGVRPNQNFVVAIDRIGERLVVQCEVRLELSQQFAELQLADVLFDLAAGKGHVGFEHRLHVVDVVV